MYGLEGDKRQKFDFDLEKEIKEQKGRKEELLKKCDQMIMETKNEMRREDKEDLGILLNGYDALKKVINKIK